MYRRRVGLNALYDLINDPTEADNLIDRPEYKDVINELHGRLTEWFSKYTDPEKDGTLKPATGRGQLKYYTDDGTIFAPDDTQPTYANEKPNYK